jgi:hypothetical protein
MDKVIVTILLIVAGVAACVALVNFVYPAVSRSEGAVVGAADAVNDRMQSQIKIINAANDGADVHVWVKNVGTVEIGSIERSDVFFGANGDFERAVFGSSGPPYPYWNYQIEGSFSSWLPAVTIKITIHLESAPSGTCKVKVVIPNGISDERVFGAQ